MTDRRLSAVPRYPDWDDKFAGLLEDTDTHAVDYRVNHTEDGKVVLIKTVQTNAVQARIVWTGQVMVLAKDDAVDLTAQFVQALADL